ncbi:MAG: hypothetical protein WBG46_10470 [Nonlabens sp.]
MGVSLAGQAILCKSSLTPDNYRDRCGLSVSILNAKKELKMSESTIDRHDFMEFFRDYEKLNTLSNDDRVEIFIYVLPGSSDITKELLDELISDFCVSNLEVSEIDE